MEILRSKVISTGVALGAGLLALTGCDNESLTPNKPGVVTEHRYDDPDTWVTITPIGKTFVPITHHDSAHWYLAVEQCGHESYVEDNNLEGCGVFEKEVSEDTYSQYQDGDSITFDK